ncbi:TIGR02281 family clan AA aspartic protease [Neoehrlichia mikurensis]|uniref:TIGR02281 family clan AA aspartic protease n=1 Tax=Neoehrlichia mikurensis TaxID=89586 RepID=A0A9Q9F3M6_9RICK|nr:TIGR02281 family clan AA aspartic protease [Neoehrlichia mikurensis]QXK91848.1 TIGR02281 family clan AA aspartic protease [Neoehrlichia mikurensis]QXK93061.1 TIGR02281 family clan AA aspartic protease [Neoehrlichia mikurensis]QXK93540.1 TIGR02281 family clan AA aspartic protease [Neoehrlichia mikurensis]UTO55504.1 TIGR02281 family clan AA aspartic protease [Neoehrlichia mikurensis]UTO56426.1 TIGR02281 family clan AA aspartic protease [Neoehrlichia mikurensis]
MNKIKSIAFWLLFIIVVALLYGAREEIINDKYVSIFVPSKSYVTKDGSIELRKSKNGHFYIRTTINGKDITFLVDTGATDVVLSLKDARKIGKYLKYLHRIKSYHTANGIIKAVYVEIPEIKIGNITVNNVKASINTGSVDTSLLGMSFLKHFSFVMKKDKLILYPSYE